LIAFETTIAFIITAGLLSLSPGPDNIFVLTQSAVYGRRTGILITLGLCTGLLVHTTLVALGVAAIIQTSLVAFTVVKIIGASYLLYLAWLAFNTSHEALDSPRSTQLSDWALYLRGIIMNITNPKVSIFFLALLPQFVSIETSSVTAQLLILGMIFIAVALAIFCGIALLAAQFGEWFKRSRRLQMNLNRMAGVIFVGLALNLIVSAI
jgi:threonine/homoserine/homoserine lactone efflux protein